MRRRRREERWGWSAHDDKMHPGLAPQCLCDFCGAREAEVLTEERQVLASECVCVYVCVLSRNKSCTLNDTS